MVGTTTLLLLALVVEAAGLAREGESTPSRQWASRSAFCCRMPVRMNSELAMGTPASRAGLHRVRSSGHEMMIRLSF